MTLFAPDRVHIGDSTPDGILLAYGYYDDETQAVLVLNQPLAPYRRYDVPLDHSDVAYRANYRTFFVNTRGEREDERHWWNLHDASNYMQEYMGQDR